MTERRERRTETHIDLLVWGLDTRGQSFHQQVRASEVSLRGALISGLETRVRTGDVVGILYAGKKARFRVIWVCSDATGEKMQAAVHRVEADACPWPDLVTEASTTNPPHSQAL